MEDTNTTYSKKRNLEEFLIYVEASNPENIVEKKLKESNFFLTTNKDEAHIIINHMTHTDCQIQYQFQTFLTTFSNLTYILNKIKHAHIKNSLFNKYPIIFKKNRIQNYKMIDASFFTLNKMAKESQSLSKFCQLLFRDEFLKKFSSAYIFTHKKGLSTAQLHYITTEDINTQTLTTAEFTKLFSAIKKSKNGSFGHSTLKAASFKIVGTCLAKEFLSKSHNLIFIISKDEFIPQSDSDILHFEKLSHYLPYFFNIFLEKDNYSYLIEQNKRLIKLVAHSETLDPVSLIHQDRFTYLLTKIREESFDLLDVNHKERISLLGELLNTLKHELSNPLFGLQLSAELLELENLPDDNDDFIYEIKLAIHRCQDIISNFSDIFMESSPIKELNLIKLIDEVLILTKSKSRHIRKEIFLNSKPLKKDDRCFIKTNKTILAQIIFNLVINSTQALSDKNESPAIAIKINAGEKFTKIIISDNGPGLKEHDISKIFIPFFTTKENGTGLGLSICKNLVHKLSGDLKYIKSDNGASFLIKLPNEYPNN